MKTVKELKAVTEVRVKKGFPLESLKAFIVFTFFTAFMLSFCDTDASGTSQRFYPDDPIWTDNDRALDASKVEPLEDSNGFDFVNHTVVKPGDRRDVRPCVSHGAGLQHGRPMFRLHARLHRRGVRRRRLQRILR